MANWYCSSADYAAVAPYATGHVYAAGAIVRQLATPAVGSERCFRTAAGGTSGGAEPAWTLTKGGSTTDSGGVVWVECTGNQTYQAAGAWGAPHARLATAVSSGWIAAGDTVYVAANHAETQTSSITITVFSSNTVISAVVCVDNSATGHVPPAAGDARTTASVTATISSITISGSLAYFYGVTFSAGGGNPNFTFGASSNFLLFESCQFASIAASPPANFNGFAVGGGVEFKNVVVTLAGTVQHLQLGAATFIWRGGSLVNATTGYVLSLTGAAPTLIDSVDFSSNQAAALVGTSAIPGALLALTDCKFAAGQQILGANTLSPKTIVDVFSSDSAALATRQERQCGEGALASTAAIVRTSGSSDGTTHLAWSISTRSGPPSWPDPFASFPIAIWNPVVGATVTLTVYGIAVMAALPNNDDIWIEARYLGSAAAPLGAMMTATKANILAANAPLAADTSAWDTQAPQRANSTAYTVNMAFAVSANPGRVFFCTTGGTTAASVPAGYASAADGGAVTDGGAVLQAGTRFKMVLALNAPQPQMAGYIRVVVKAARIGTIFIVDPLVALS